MAGFHPCAEGLITHDGSKDLARHLGNARRQDLPQRDEQGKALWLIRKERPDSPHKIDLAMACVLSWEARVDAIAAGALAPEPQFQLVVFGAWVRRGRSRVDAPGRRISVAASQEALGVDLSRR